MIVASTSGVCAVLPWDSEFFQAKIARLQPTRLTPEAAAEAEAFCAREGVECLYFLAASDDAASIALAEARGFRLVDVRVTLARAQAPAEGSGAPHATDAPTIRPALAADLPELRRLAAASHTDTRFFADPRLAPRAPALYARWIERSFEDAAGAVFVATLGGAPLAYLTCAVGTDAAREGNIGLVAVADAIQRRGVGSSLLRAGLGWLARAGAPRTTVVTQGRNVAAQALYQRAGFVTHAVELWFHLWR